MITPLYKSSDSLEAKGKLLKVGETAEKLYVSEQTVRDWQTSHKLTVGETTSGGHRLFYESDIARTELAEKGDTTFWSATGIVVLKNTGEVELLCDDNASVFPDLEETDFERWWSYNNGFEKLVWKLARTKTPQVFEISARDVELWGDVEQPAWELERVGTTPTAEDSDDVELWGRVGNSNAQLLVAGIQTSITVVAFTREEAITARQQVFVEVSNWLRTNFIPKSVLTIAWHTNDGTKLTH